ncbi:MAG TPA: oligosaccharide flippase family protein [Tepidisphaeraceae bacterium]|jgi:PST family polysaccharide transporter|nr:oligosaccharide flippase family protein [Tepidisphaeraceae bacterium]
MDLVDQPGPEVVVPPTISLGHRAAVGFVWMALQTIASKIITVAGQVVLAWLLSDADFGLVALAFTATSFPAQINQIGLKEVLVRRSKRYHLWASSAHWMALAFGLLSALTMVAIAPPAAHFFKAPQLFGLISVIAIAAPIDLLSQVVAIKIQIDLRFRVFAILAFILAVGGILLSVLFAAMGAGAYSFVLPLPIVAAMRLAIAWLMVHPPFQWRINLQRWRYLIGDSLILLTARIFAACVMIGDYLSLGFFHPKPVVGIYYFAYILSLQTIVLFSVNLEGVLFPTLSKLTNDLSRQRDGFLAAARVLAIVAIPVCFLQAALSAPAIHAIFPAKWLPSIPVLQVLCIGMAFRSVGFPSFSLMQAQGRFKSYSMLLGIGAALFLALTLITSAISPDSTAAVRVAQVVALYFVLEGPIAMYVAIRHAGGAWRDVWKVYAFPVLLSAVACGAAAGAIRLLPAQTRVDHLVRMIAAALIAGAIYLPMIRLLAPQTWATLTSRVRAMIKR